MSTTFQPLLATLTQSLLSALDSTEKLEAPTPVQDGISLLDVKNELFLSYLQNLVFLIILKLRHHKNGSNNEKDSEELNSSVVKKLVELQVYLEKGVRPLEARLKYQIDKVLRAADDARRAQEAATPKRRPAARNTIHDSDADSDVSDDENTADGVPLQAAEINDLQHRPNPAAFVRLAGADDSSSKRDSGDGVYKPPRIQATSMPTTTGPRVKELHKGQKSATIEEFVSTELSAAPYAQPSIGTTTVSGGRRTKSDKERQVEAERKDYEERNYVRLPKESKKDKKKKAGRERPAGYGGEDWRDLGEGVERIDRLTKRKGGVSGPLEKGRKRKADDGPRGEGVIDAGHAEKKRLKNLETGRRDRGRSKRE